MTFRRRLALLSAIALALAAVPVAAAAPAPGPQIDTSDVERFFALYDAAGGHPTAEALQRGYIDGGSAGLHDFVRARSLTGANLAAAIALDAKPFESARGCLAVFPRVRTRLVAALARLQQLHPESRFPPITVLVGRAKTGGTTSPAGVLIGLETICSVAFLEANREDRLVHLIAHEYAHVQQPASEQTDLGGATVLFAALVEGGAEFVAELTSGGVSYPHLPRWAKGRENAIERQFLADCGKTDLKEWLYNGLGTPDRPGDLGYWIGYRVARDYYRRAANKRLALSQLLAVTPQTAPAILAGSGRRAGTQCQA